MTHTKRIDVVFVWQVLEAFCARWLERSDSWIAKHVGCDHKTVEKQRERLEAVREIPKLDSLLGEDGKRYPRSRAAAVIRYGRVGE